MKDLIKRAEAVQKGMVSIDWSAPSAFWKGGGKPKYCEMDFETYGEVDLPTCGSYRYILDETFEPLLLAVAFDDEDVFIIDLARGEEVPDIVWAAVFDDEITKVAWNAQFERTIFGKMVGHTLSPDSWKCAMVWAASLSLPLALKNAAAVLKTGEQKDKEGERLIRYFSVPCKPTKANGGRTRNLPEHAPEDWELFKSYCIQDVRTERDIRKKLEAFPMKDSEWDYYHMDQRINDRGVLIDKTLVEQAITCDLMLSEAMTKRAYELTGLENPNSVSQLKGWLEERGIEIDSLGKKDVAALITDLDKHSTDQEALDMLKLRLQMAKSSVKKYQAADRCICDDGRVRGLFQFNGANRTGRFAGRLLQIQNLPQNHISTLDEARELVKLGCFDMVESIYENTPDILSQLIRTMLIAKPGHQFIVADFSAIEARVLAWLAGEQWVLEAFRNGEDLYCSVASQMFGVPVVKHGVNSELRQKGKIATLACGYQGSVGAMVSMGAIDMGLKESELQDIIDSWREANPHIVQFWWDVERAAVDTIKDHQDRKVGRIGFQYYAGSLWMVLPSGRKLAYIKPKMQPNRFGRMAITFEGLNAANKWSRGETYGGKLVENCLSQGTLVLTHRGLVPIEQIVINDLIWDGEEWVQHEGAVCKGTQETVEIKSGAAGIGIHMTPNHKILTEKGWIECGESEGLDWTEVREPDSCWPGRVWKVGRIPMGLSMRLWKCDKQIHGGFNKEKAPHKIMWMSAEVAADRPDRKTIWISDCTGKSKERQERKDTVEVPMLLWRGDRHLSRRTEEKESGIHLMRMYERFDNFHETKNTWPESSSCLRSLAQHEATLPRSKPSCLPQLRRAWNDGLRTLAGKLREFLGRHGSNLEERVGFGSDRQQPRLRAWKLSLGDQERKYPEQKEVKDCGFTTRPDDSWRAVRENGNTSEYPIVPIGSQLANRISVYPTGRKEQVYDIRNCGPRHRFTVWDPGAEQLRIVSNCTQATARDLLLEAMWRVERAGLDIVGHVHDEMILEVPTDSITVDEVVRIMSINPAWAEGLPLNADGYSGFYYFKS